MNMKWCSRTVCVLFAIGIFGAKTFAETPVAAGAIQIVSPVNHSFELHLSELNEILENENIKDRHVVVVSIAGAYRQGKSFLLNFFLKFLYAQYQKHDVTDWIGDYLTTSEFEGFKSRSGRERETTGIWIWSEIFTYDFENGDKVAIVLMDTQGIFDSRSSVHDCTTIFSLSMMLSSVQCYNLMGNIKEDDLQHLELFTEYGRLALEQTNEKPFENLLFIVRDWPFAVETNYGWNGQKIVEEIFAGNEEQTPEMRQLRDRIKSSFEKIEAFLMPHPGFAVAHGKNFAGEMAQIDEEFQQYVKELIPGVLAPEKLVVKKINGQKIRARDFTQYLQAYTNIFNGDTLPEAKTVLMATAEASSLILYNDCLSQYVNAMDKAFENVDSFLGQQDLQTLHANTKTAALTQFVEKPNLGGDEIKAKFQQKLENAIDERFDVLKQENARKRNEFIVRANLHNDKIVSEITDSIKKKMLEEVENTMAISDSTSGALEEFDSKKMGDAEISNGHREPLRQELDNLRSCFEATMQAFHGNVQHYATAMQNLLNANEYFSRDVWLGHHQNTKNQAVAQLQAHPGDNELKFCLQRKLEANIDQQWPQFEAANEAKRQSFLTRAHAHSEAVGNEARASFEARVRAGIGGSYLNDETFINLFISNKQQALQEFESRKMGEDELSIEAYHHHRGPLEQSLDTLQGPLRQANDANKPPRRKKRRGWKNIFGR